MFRPIICLLLCATLCYPAEPPVAKAAQLSSGTVVDVWLVSGERIRGRVQSVTPESLELMTASASAIDTRTIPFQDIKSIRQPSRAGRNVLMGLGGVFLFGLALVAAGFRNS